MHPLAKAAPIVRPLQEQAQADQVLRPISPPGRGGSGGGSRTSVDYRSNVLATKCRSEPARHGFVYDPHALEMAGGCHDLEKRMVKRQHPLKLCKIWDIRLAQKLRLFSASAPGIDGEPPFASSTIVRPAAPSASARRNAPVSALWIWNARNSWW
jgi:hypothetical protein